MSAREEAEDIIDEVAFDPDLSASSVIEIAERVAPGRADVRAVLNDLHNTFFVDEHVLEYYVDRLERILKK